MGKLILIILSLSLFLFPVSSHAISEYDGHEWSNWTTFEKGKFLIGFTSGSGYVVSSSWDPLFETEKNIFAKIMGVTEREIEKYKRIQRHHILGITIGQLKDGLNSFYNDFRNKRIRLGTAIYIVKKQIEVSPPEEVNAIIHHLRKHPKHDDYSFFTGMKYKDKSGNERQVIFP